MWRPFGRFLSPVECGSIQVSTPFNKCLHCKMVEMDFLICLLSSGPLLYHFENMANELSVEPSYEDIKTAIVAFGFQLEVKICLQIIYSVCIFGGLTIFLCIPQVEKQSVQTTYTENDRSMLRYVYDCVFFVARKPAENYFNGFQKSQPGLPPLAKAARREGINSLT